MAIRTKADIEFHGDHGPSVPAVNVKVKWLSTAEWDRLAARVATDEGHPRPAEFSRAWIDAELSDDQQDTYYQLAIEHAWEQLETDVNDGWASPIFGRRVKVFSQGRSGGWAVVEGITRADAESWDAIGLARWRKFARVARETADNVPYQYLSLIYLNKFTNDGEPREAQVWEGRD
jgi:hypothetical protein